MNRGILHHPLCGNIDVIYCIVLDRDDNTRTEQIYTLYYIVPYKKKKNSKNNNNKNMPKMLQGPRKREARLGRRRRSRNACHFRFKRVRFGQEQKKGHKGISTHYISRSRAINNLQLSLNDFVDYCILKGIYPRDPEGLKN